MEFQLLKKWVQKLGLIIRPRSQTLMQIQNYSMVYGVCGLSSITKENLTLWVECLSWPKLCHYCHTIIWAMLSLC